MLRCAPLDALLRAWHLQAHIELRFDADGDAEGMLRGDAVIVEVFEILTVTAVVR